MLAASLKVMTVAVTGTATSLSRLCRESHAGFGGQAVIAR
jgi:hypothetical protein